MLPRCLNRRFLMLYQLFGLHRNMQTVFPENGKLVFVISLVDSLPDLPDTRMVDNPG